jgi:hypothetical protein
MKLKNLATLLLCLLPLGTSFSDEAMLTHIDIFPIDNYSQNINQWINSNSKNYNTPLVSQDKQLKRLSDFNSHFFSSAKTAKSPWNYRYVNALFTTQNNNSIYYIEQSNIENFSNKNKPSNLIGIGANFRPYTEKWITNIVNNMDISRLKHIRYLASNRAIAVNNLMGRILPTDDPFFYSYRTGGQGYPFDNMQQSAVWAGTPIYIIYTTLDKSWALILTPDFIAWVPSNGIAQVSNSFVKAWRVAANKSLIAITKVTSIIDNNHIFHFNAHIGSVFPGRETNGKIQILIPIANTHMNAVIRTATINANNAAVMPLSLTPHNISLIIANLIGKSYGWGNMYMYNDCSAEIKSLFTPFAIYLARNTETQSISGKVVDLSSKSAIEREKYLMSHGHPLLTLIHIPGHILLYIGNFPNQNSKQHENIAMSYQNIWGLHTGDNNKRAVIGYSVFLPLLLSYPEDLNLLSFYDPKTKPVFELSYLDKWP